MAIAGILSQYWQAKGARLEARDARVQERTSETYVRLLSYLFLVERIMQLTKPMASVKPAPPIPALPSDDESRDLQARVSAFASPEVRKLVDEWFEARVMFESCAVQIDLAEPGTDKIDAYTALHEARQQARGIVDALQERVNAELRSSTRRDRWWRLTRGR